MNAEQLAQALGAVRSGRQWKCKCVRARGQLALDDYFRWTATAVPQVRCMAGCEPADIIETCFVRVEFGTRCTRRITHRYAVNKLFM